MIEQNIIRSKENLRNRFMDTIKLTHAYAFELVRASKTMAVDLAEKQPHIQVIRTNLQKKLLRGEQIN